MIKILIEGISQNLGGIETFVYNLYKSLDKSLYEVSFLKTKGLKIAFEEEYKNNGCKFFEVEDRKKSYKKYLSDLKNIYLNNEFDIIHINVMSYSLFERITYACKFSKAKVVVHSHSTGYAKGYYKTRILHKIGKFMTRKCNYYRVACGEDAGKFMFSNKKFTIFNNGIDIEKFTFSDIDRNDIRKELNIDKSTFVMCLVGVFFPVKNHNFLIDVFYEYNKLQNNSMLLLVGEGTLQEEIKQKVMQLGLQDKVKFLRKKI
jgi:glycosyltransferase involved in cell wall biosynthesis